MPGANDARALELAGGEAGEEVRAAVLDGEDLAVDVGDAGAGAVNVGDGDRAGREIAERADVDFGQGRAPVGASGPVRP